MKIFGQYEHFTRVFVLISVGGATVVDAGVTFGSSFLWVSTCLLRVVIELNLLLQREQ